jgi:hypothetical protein
MVGPSPFFGSQKISGTENMASFDIEISLNNIIQLRYYKGVHNNVMLPLMIAQSSYW